MIYGLDKVIKNLKKVRTALDIQIDNLFIQKSLIWIRDRAIEILNSRLSFTPNWFGTDVTSTSTWQIKQITNKHFILENTYENSASIEFGIGVVGEQNKHSEANNVGYEYNVPSEYKDIDGSWNFTDQLNQVWYRFSGYEGKSFLYDAFMEYKQNNIWVKKYQEAFDEIIRRVLK